MVSLTDVRSIERTVDVSAVVGEPAATAVTVHLPDEVGEESRLVFAFPGGGYSRRYFDLVIDGESGYSQAVDHTGRGLILVACDHLASGDSTSPADPSAATLEMVAAVNHATVGRIRTALETGELDADLPPVHAAASIGIGQSMGVACSPFSKASTRPSTPLPSSAGRSPGSRSPILPVPGAWRTTVRGATRT